MISYQVEKVSSGIGSGSGGSDNCGSQLGADKAIALNSNYTEEIVTVTTAQGTYKTHKLVLTVGAWAPSVYGTALPFELVVERRVLFWFEPIEVAGENYQVRNTSS